MIFCNQQNLGISAKLKVNTRCSALSLIPLKSTSVKVQSILIYFQAIQVTAGAPCLLAHHVLEVRRAQLARLVAQVPVLGDGGEVGGAHVDPRDEVLPDAARTHAGDVSWPYWPVRSVKNIFR